jgi:hypothetical protein
VTGDEEIIVHPFLERDQMGDEQWGDDRTIKSCIAWPATSAEIEAGGYITDGWNVFIPPGEPEDNLPGPRDEITLHGVRYEVKGVPGRYRYNEDKGTILVLAKAGA